MTEEELEALGIKPSDEVKQAWRSWTKAKPMTADELVAVIMELTSEPFRP